MLGFVAVVRSSIAVVAGQMAAEFVAVVHSQPIDQGLIAELGRLEHIVVVAEQLAVGLELVECIVGLEPVELELVEHIPVELGLVELGSVEHILVEQVPVGLEQHIAELGLVGLGQHIVGLGLVGLELELVELEQHIVADIAGLELVGLAQHIAGLVPVELALVEHIVADIVGLGQLVEPALVEHTTVAGTVELVGPVALGVVGLELGLDLELAQQQRRPMAMEPGKYQFSALAESMD